MGRMVVALSNAAMQGVGTKLGTVGTRGAETESSGIVKLREAA